jgi:AraC family cel operon transcriptional repressor
VVRGRVVHYINGKRQILEEGSFAFVRDFDIHYYEKCNNEEYHFINLVFLATTLQALFDYVGTGYPLDSFMKPEIVPVVQLSAFERQEVRSRLESLAAIPGADQQKMRSRLRILLLEFFTQFFIPEKQVKGKTLSWLENLKMEMKKIENFTEGITAMQRLSQKHPDYLSRAWRKFDNKTPTEFINELRLDYVANLLLHSDDSILNIALTAGFCNMSYFYNVFQRKFGTTPSAYRTSHMRKWFTV